MAEVDTGRIGWRRSLRRLPLERLDQPVDIRLHHDLVEAQRLLHQTPRERTGGDL